LVEATGATAGAVVGRYRDRQYYDLLLKSDHGAIHGLATEIAEEFERNRIDYLVSGAAEGYNPGHDACRLTAAVIARRLGIQHFEFPIAGRPCECPAASRRDGISILLDEGALVQKLAAAWGYEPLPDEAQ